MNRVGVEGEQIAAEYLESHGMRVVERNFSARCGEIDIVARDDDYLVFVEVKSRMSYRYGVPSVAVNKEKQKKIVKTAQYYLMAKGCVDVNVRFDVVEVFADKVHHIRNAFWIN